jgi:hypothetical protein
MSSKRVSFSIRDRDARLVRKLARHWKVPEADVLRLAVWAYVLPLVPSLKAPVELPPLDLPAVRDAPVKSKRRVELGRTTGRR